MKVTILGGGTALPRKGYTQSGYLLEWGHGERVLLDCGAGKLGHLCQIGVDSWTLDRIFLTHFHLDHVGDLPSLLFAKGNPTLEENEDLIIYGPSEMAGYYQSLRRMYGSMVAPKKYHLEVQPFPLGATLYDKGAKIQAFLLQHQSENYGYRFEVNGKVFAYCGDTEMCRGAIELGRNADLYILECAFPDGSPLEGHLTPSEAAKIASQAQCRHLVVTHRYGEALDMGEGLAEQIGKTFSGKITLARDFLELEV